MIPMLIIAFIVFVIGLYLLIFGPQFNISFKKVKRDVIIDPPIYQEPVMRTFEQVYDCVDKKGNRYYVTGTNQGNAIYVYPNGAIRGAYNNNLDNNLKLLNE